MRLHSRLWNASLVQEYSENIDRVQIMSNAKLTVDPSLDIVQPDFNDFANVSTNIFMVKNAVSGARFLTSYLVMVWLPIWQVLHDDQ